MGGKAMKSVFVAQWLLSLVICSPLGGGLLAAPEQGPGIPLVELATPLAHPDIFAASTGASLDSLVLRVSLGYRFQEIDSHPFFVIEEIVSPLPVVMHIDLPGDQPAERPVPKEVLKVFEVNGLEFLDQFLDRQAVTTTARGDSSKTSDCSSLE